MLREVATPRVDPHSAQDGEEAVFPIWRERCLLLQNDLEKALAHFTFIADVTALTPDCRFVGDEATLVACYDELPFAAVSFHTDNGYTDDSSVKSPDPSSQVAVLTSRLVASDQSFYCLVSEEQWPLVKAAYRVLEVDEEWQMLFRGDADALDPGDAVPLSPSDLPEMKALAHREAMMAFENNPLSRGPWYGIRRDGRLVAQGGTHLVLSRAAEIGNIVTTEAHRRRGFASCVISALVRDLHEQGKAIFLQVFKSNEPAVACYERLGFERLRTMYLAKCQV